MVFADNPPLGTQDQAGRVDPRDKQHRWQCPRRYRHRNGARYGDHEPVCHQRPRLRQDSLQAVVQMVGIRRQRRTPLDRTHHDEPEAVDDRHDKPSDDSIGVELTLGHVVGVDGQEHDGEARRIGTGIAQKQLATQIEDQGHEQANRQKHGQWINLGRLT